MSQVDLDEKSVRMLELLAMGASTKDMATRMGYVVGTVRVYLHNLYRKLGVTNRTGAVVWYYSRRPLTSPGGGPTGDAPGDNTAEVFGDFALNEGLYAALGSMSIFLGPQGRVWEVAIRLKGRGLDANAKRRRDRTRRLWRALLEGDFAHGKQWHDREDLAAMLDERPADAVLAAMLLILGGYSTAAKSLHARIRRTQKHGSGVTLRECALLGALAHAHETGARSTLSSLHQLATQTSAPVPVRQLAMVGLFHVYRARKDSARARQTANAIWSAAEEARRELEAMGDRYHGAHESLPGPDHVATKSAAAHEKAQAARS